MAEPSSVDPRPSAPIANPLDAVSVRMGDAPTLPRIFRHPGWEVERAEAWPMPSLSRVQPWDFRWPFEGHDGYDTVTSYASLAAAKRDGWIEVRRV